MLSLNLTIQQVESTMHMAIEDQTFSQNSDISQSFNTAVNGSISLIPYDGYSNITLYTLMRYTYDVEDDVRSSSLSLRGYRSTNLHQSLLILL